MLSTLNKRAAQQKRLPNLSVDCSAFLAKGDKDTVIVFREPGSPELFPATTRRELLKATYPSFTDNMMYQILVMSASYMPAENEQSGVNLDLVLSEIADTKRDLFMHLVNQFSAAYPMAKIDADEAGNA